VSTTSSRVETAAALITARNVTGHRTVRTAPTNSTAVFTTIRFHSEHISLIVVLHTVYLRPELLHCCITSVSVSSIRLKGSSQSRIYIT